MNKILIAFVLAFGYCFTASAQYSQDPNVDYVQINAKGWLFCPVTDTQSVLGFLAVVDDASITGANIQILWYERESDGSWSTWGWADAQQVGESVWWVRTHVNDPLAFMYDTTLNEAAEAVGPDAAVDPVQLGNGLFLDDPFQAAVQQVQDPAALLDVLSAAGWQSAPGMSALAAGGTVICDGQAVDAVQNLLDGMASEVELDYFGSSSTSSSCSWPCKCKTKWKTTCDDWKFDHSYVQGSIKYCVYTKTCTTTRTRSGLTWLLCDPCGSVDSWDNTKSKTTQVLVGDPCEPPVE